ncbi:hypothetical protein NMEN93004_0859 [Neisseria meningitidis 93004]|uniref:Uncharacterized protein n=1 Tax=Neisseria meningitidis TaxID=487 RepID=A0A378VQ11_NEIME|nr:hypothetical protein NMEN93003_0801 [Neisseria meningitidis 93003]EJU55767.1 hypothetical protein NMEN93004_0859 [Neisseria meningitidis 93004]EJU76920.1 hypothetical protein NMEN2795_0860 [Neisseria meningitidis NM2795]EOC15849.1 hypothetical protein NM81858_0876 [Neisseria meningitidis 81858]SUA19090.1 Uncharacterised protein [Neisseria meningitidis]
MFLSKQRLNRFIAVYPQIVLISAGDQSFLVFTIINGYPKILNN